MYTCRYFQTNWHRSQPPFYPEVFYPEQFVTCYPWGECQYMQTNYRKKIYDISHITHKQPAALIESENGFSFKPAAKYGKCGDVPDGSPLGESYRCVLKIDAPPTTETKYLHIRKNELVLPEGYYSWWGSGSVEKSLYGSVKFTTPLNSAIGKFAWSKRVCASEQPGVFLRVAGTLRYRKEICFVIVIHTDTDATDEIKNLPPLSEPNESFELNGFLDEDGRVVNWRTSPTFIHKSYSDNCYNIFAFAFYFSNEDESFQVEKVVKTSVKHEKCIRRFQDEDSNRWLCPDQV